MSECRDKRIKDLLHGYELGILDGDELTAVEQHLLVCDECLHEVEQFHETAGHILNSPDIRRLVEETEAQQKSPAAGAKRRRLWATLVPIAAIVLLLLVLHPWQIEIQPTHDVRAAGDRVIVMCFDSQDGSETAYSSGEIVASLLATDLAESRFFQVVSYRRLKDIMKTAGVTDFCAVDSSALTDIAQRAGARWIITGRIDAGDTALLIDTRLIDAESGRMLSEQRVIGAPGEDMFALIDRLSVTIKEGMPLPVGAMQETDRRVAEVTTHSQAAYRSYLEGVEYAEMGYYSEAIGAFEKALEYDSTFAMVYYHLTYVKDPKYIALAMRYADNATAKERQYIHCLAAAYRGDYPAARAYIDTILTAHPDEKDAHMLLGNLYYRTAAYDSAISHYRFAIAIDPLFRKAYNQLAATFQRMGDLESAIVTIDKYIDLAPDEAMPYDARGQYYSDLGNIDKAIRSYETALEKKTDYPEALKRLGILHSFKREYDSAAQFFERAVTISGYNRRIWVRLFQGCLLTRRGMFDSALVTIQRQVTQEISQRASIDFLTQAYLAMALIHRQQGDYDLALRDIREVVRIGDAARPDYSVNYRHFYVQLLAESGDMATARRELAALKAAAERDNSWFVHSYAKGAIALADGDYDTAVESFRHATQLRSNLKRYGYFEARAMLALAYLKAGQLDLAVAEYETITTPYTYHRAYWSLWDVKQHYYLATAYEESRWNRRALTEYRIFLDYWQDGDDDIPEVREARARVAQLEKNL